MELSKWRDHDLDFEGGLEACNWNDLEDSEKEERARDDARLRQIFDPVEGVLNFTKKKVKESKHNSYTGLPKEMAPEDEALIHLRRRIFKGILR